MQNAEVITIPYLRLFPVFIMLKRMRRSGCNSFFFLSHTHVAAIRWIIITFHTVTFKVFRGWTIKNFGDPLTFHLAPPAGQTFHFPGSIPTSTTTFEQICMIPRWCTLMINSSWQDLRDWNDFWFILSVPHRMNSDVCWAPEFLSRHALSSGHLFFFFLFRPTLCFRAVRYVVSALTLQSMYVPLQDVQCQVWKINTFPATNLFSSSSFSMTNQQEKNIRSFSPILFFDRWEQSTNHHHPWSIYQTKHGLHWLLHSPTKSPQLRLQW